MAKIRVETIREFYLELSEAEASYLKDILQNYLGAGEEYTLDRTIRERLFKELHSGFHPDMEEK